MRLVVVGEGMVEFVRRSAGWQTGYGGDTLNTSIHLARFGHPVAFASAMGEDPFSVELRDAWQREGVSTDLLLTDPRRSCGLYAVQTDAVGERTFSYWRSESAARAMFDHPRSEWLAAQIRRADLLFFSGISLAVLPDAGRARLIQLAGEVCRAGGRVVFDGNYRPRLWNTPKETERWRDAAVAVADVGLPTLEDEQALSGFGDAEAVARHWQELGAAETIVKLGARGCRLPDGSLVPPPAVLSPVDTSGAGDAFNAGYLHGRLSGQTIAASASIGHRLAGWVVARQGAVPERESGIYDG